MISLESGGIVASRYRLERPLAHGGMGAVWVARHIELDVLVAIKIMAPEYASSASARARFEREAKACALIKSPNVVQIHDYGVADESPFLVMELLQGEDLSARLARERRLAPAVAAGLLLGVCKGLRRAHELGIVHRDIKPANIFITREDDVEVVKVLDFGVARLLGPALAGDMTRAGALLGSPFYMSPEQARGKHVDHRSDLWSVGVVLFEAITGRPAFVGDEMADVLFQIHAGPIPAPSQIAPDLGPDFDVFFARALARDPDQRFQTALELAEALSAMARGQSAWSPPRAADLHPTEIALPATAPGIDSTPVLSPAGRPLPIRPLRAALVALAALGVVSLALAVSRSAGRVAHPAKHAMKFSFPAAPPLPVAIAPVEPPPEVAPRASASASAVAPPATRSPPAAPRAPPPRKRDPTFGF